MFRTNGNLLDKVWGIMDNRALDDILKWKGCLNMYVNGYINSYVNKDWKDKQC